MAKNIRWQIPFVSIGGTHYRIDIYDEGTFTPVTLTGGTSPFTTSEDDSDDYFAPIRTQSGTIEVCTLMPDGNYITLDDLLPANNIARPVRLINRDNSDAIEWQGFLSCEAYDQDYTGIPQILQLPVISVLEAMDSVEVNPTTLSGMMYVFEIVYNTFHEIEQQSGMSLFDTIFYPKTDWRIFTKYIDTTAFFKQNEYNNENSTTYIVSGISCKEVLEKIATYMGWIVREHKTWLYFQRVSEDLGMYRQSALDFLLAFHSPGYYISRPLVTKELATDPAVVWMGTDHKRTVSQGAKSVEVVARLMDSKVNISIPEFPAGEVGTSFKQISNGSGSTRYLYSIISKNYSAYDSIIFNFYAGTGTLLNDNTPSTDCYRGVSTFEEVFPTLFLSNPGRDLYTLPRYAGAFYIKIANEEEETSEPRYSNGLYLSFIPGLRQGTTVALNLAPIFKFTTPLSYSLQNGGTLKLNIEAFHLYARTGQQGRYQYISDSGGILAHLRIGNNYWNGSGWVQSPTIFALSFEDGKKTISSVLSSRLEGQIEIAFYPHGVMTHTATPIGPHQDLVHNWILNDEVVISRLDMSYEAKEDPNLTDRGENHYFRLLGTNYRDEIIVNTDFASTLNNRPSPSLIMNTNTAPMKVLDYSTSAEDPSIVESRRPEVDLINRLETYYSESRQRLELEMAHIESPALPLLKLNGINDGKVYLPLAESRDWQQETCTLTCFETPTEPQESQS